jgi:hypothetical protein
MVTGIIGKKVGMTQLLTTAPAPGTSVKRSRLARKS